VFVLAIFVLAIFDHGFFFLFIFVIAIFDHGIFFLFIFFLFMFVIAVTFVETVKFDLPLQFLVGVYHARGSLCKWK
jgi:hypothetical protein